LPSCLCEDRSTLSDCKDNKQETKTNESGDYRFASVTPSEYTVQAKAFDKPYWIFAKEAQPTISWQPYAGADYDALDLSPQQGSAIITNERVYASAPSKFQVPVPLLSCKYSLTIVAYNADKVKIAEQEETFSEFTVTGQDAPCEAKITSPARDAANVARTGASFAWESHTRAAYYKIVLYPAAKSDAKVLDFVKIEGAANYKLDKNLEPGKYNWWIQVCDKEDKHIASSTVAAFTVK